MKVIEIISQSYIQIYTDRNIFYRPRFTYKTDSPDLRTAKLVLGLSATAGVGSETGRKGLVMLSLDTTDGAGTGAGTGTGIIVGMGTIAGGGAVDTAGILMNDGSGDLATTRDDRVDTGSGDTGSGAGRIIGMATAFDPDDREVVVVGGFWSMMRSCSLDCESGVSERMWITDASGTSDCGLDARRGSKCSSRSRSIYISVSIVQSTTK